MKSKMDAVPKIVNAISTKLTADAALPGRYECDDILQALHSKECNTPVLCTPEQRTQVLDYTQSITELRKKLQRLQTRRDKLQDREKEVLDVVRTVSRYLRSESDDDLRGLSEEHTQLVRDLRKASQPTTPLGALLDVTLKRAATGNDTSQLSPILIQFAVALCNVSKAAYLRIRASIPDLPSLDTIQRYNSSLLTPNGNAEKNLMRLLDTANTLRLSAGARAGNLMNDDMNIQSV